MSESKHTDKLNADDSDFSKYIEEPWTLIESYFKGKLLEKLVRHQLESYNDFITYQIQKTIDMFNPVVVHSEQDYDEESKKYKLEKTFDDT